MSLIHCGYKGNIQIQIRFRILHLSLGEIVLLQLLLVSIEVKKNKIKLNNMREEVSTLSKINIIPTENK